MIKKSIQVCEFLKSVLESFNDVAESLSGKSIREDILKLLTVSFQCISNSLIEYLSVASGEYRDLSESEKSLVNKLLECGATINLFLILIMQERQKETLLCQYETSLLDIIKETIGRMNESQGRMTKLIELKAIIMYYFNHFLSLLILAGYNEVKKFMKSAAHDALKCSLEILLRSQALANSGTVTHEVFSLPVPDVPFKWFNSEDDMHHFTAVIYGKKIFSLICYPQDFKSTAHPAFTLRSFTLYCANKIAQVLISRDAFTSETQTMESLTAAIKRNSGILTELAASMIAKDKEDSLSPIKKTIESLMCLLNENLACLRFLKHILAKSSDPLALLEKHGCTVNLTNLLKLHMYVVLNKGFVSERNYTSEKDAIEIVNFMKNKGFVAGVFRLLNKVKFMKIQVISSVGAKTMKVPGVLMDEILMEIFSYIDQTSIGDIAHIAFFKALIVEYLCDPLSLRSPILVEQMGKVIGSRLFSFTGPDPSLKFFSLQRLSDEVSEDILSIATQKKLLLTFKSIVCEDKKWLITVFNILLQSSQKLLAAKKPESLLGLYKLLYLFLSGTLHDNISFASFILHGVPKPFSYEAFLAGKLNSATGKQDEIKALSAFNEVLGSIYLIENLLKEYYTTATTLGKTAPEISLTPSKCEEEKIPLSQATVEKRNIIKNPELSPLVVAISKEISNSQLSFSQSIAANAPIEISSSSDTTASTNAANNKDICVKITEHFILHILNIHSLCEPIIKSAESALTILNYCLQEETIKKNPSSFYILQGVFQRVLGVMKYSKAISHDKIDPEGYLPLIIIKEVSKRLQAKIVGILPFIELLLEFLAYDNNSPSLIQHQLILFSHDTIDMLSYIFLNNGIWK